MERLILFSDWEGTSPLGTPPEGVETDPASGLIRGLGEGVRLVYLGDLVDHGPYELRQMANMLRLREEYGGRRVVLIAGNRDCNKMRAAEEQLIARVDDGEPAVGPAELSSFEDMVGLARRVSRGWGTAFRFARSAAEEPLAGRYARNAQFRLIREREEPLSDGLDRVQQIHVLTYNSPLFERAKGREWRELFGWSDSSLSREERWALVALMNGVATAAAAPPGAASDYPRPDQPGHYLGIVPRYLSACSVAECLTVGKQRVFVSHSGIPREPLTAPYALRPSPRSVPPSPPEYVLERINEEFRKNVRDEGWVRRWTSTPNPRSLLTGGVEPWEEDEESDSEGDDPADGPGPVAEAWCDVNAERFDYTVFGHRPQGLAPTVWLGDDGRIAAGLDVSKLPAELDDTGFPREDYGVFASITIRADGGATVAGRTVHMGSRMEYSYAVPTSLSAPAQAVEGYLFKIPLGGGRFLHQRESPDKELFVREFDAAGRPLGEDVSAGSRLSSVWRLRKKKKEAKVVGGGEGGLLQRTGTYGGLAAAAFALLASALLPRRAPLWTAP